MHTMKLVEYKHLSENLEKDNYKNQTKKIEELEEKIKELKLQLTSQSVWNVLSKKYYLPYKNGW